jgi:hypothetical protein
MDYDDEIEVKYSGRSNQNQEKISLRFVVPVQTGRVPASAIATRR